MTKYHFYDIFSSMIHESQIAASFIDTSGAYKECVALCLDCPRRTGEQVVKAKGIFGALGRRETISVHSNPLKSGILRSLQTNGRHGIFYGDGAENTGTVTGLREGNAGDFIEAVATCTGPIAHGNVCHALGAKSLGAICDLDASMEEAIDRRPIEEVVASIAFDSTKAPASDLPETQVFINNSQAGL